MKKFDLLVKQGVKKNLAILICWEDFSDQEKEKITFEQCHWVWENTPSDSPEEAEALAMVKAKAETFEQCRWVWENTPSGSSEEAEAWSVVKAKSETFEQCQ